MRTLYAEGYDAFLEVGPGAVLTGLVKRSEPQAQTARVSDMETLQALRDKLTGYIDNELSGLVLGQTLATRPEHLYRALLEATAFGTRVIVEAFRRLNDPPEVLGIPMLVVAVAGLLANLAAFALLREGAKESIKVEATARALNMPDHSKMN